jgi:FtsH-binding integral membrane protein
MAYQTEYENPYESPANPWAQPAALAETDARVTFIRRTYLHLAGAIALFVAFEAAVFTLVPEPALDEAMGLLFASRFGWLGVMLGLMVTSWIANFLAANTSSSPAAYAGLGLYVVAQGIVFVPLLYLAEKFAPAAIPAAGVLTLVMFGGLTALVFVTRSDLTSWGKYLWAFGLAAIGVIVCAIFFNFSLGIWFSGLMVLLASAYILYDTSNVLHRYATNQYVPAALALFASVVLLFWYILQIMMSLSRR